MAGRAPRTGAQAPGSARTRARHATGPDPRRQLWTTGGARACHEAATGSLRGKAAGKTTAVSAIDIGVTGTTEGGGAAMAAAQKLQVWCWCTRVPPASGCDAEASTPMMTEQISSIWAPAEGAASAGNMPAHPSHTISHARIRRVQRDDAAKLGIRTIVQFPAWAMLTIFAFGTPLCTCARSGRPQSRAHDNPVDRTACSTTRRACSLRHADGLNVPRSPSGAAICAVRRPTTPRWPSPHIPATDRATVVRCRRPG